MALTPLMESIDCEALLSLSDGLAGWKEATSGAVSLLCSCTVPVMISSFPSASTPELMFGIVFTENFTWPTSHVYCLLLSYPCVRVTAVFFNVTMPLAVSMFSTVQPLPEVSLNELTSKTIPPLGPRANVRVVSTVLPSALVGDATVSFSTQLVV